MKLYFVAAADNIFSTGIIEQEKVVRKQLSFKDNESRVCMHEGTTVAMAWARDACDAHA
jgi:hypothetical protein